MKTLVLEFVKEKETRMQVRFGEVVSGDDLPHVGKLYVRRDLAGSATTLKVVISELSERDGSQEQM